MLIYVKEQLSYELPPEMSSYRSVGAFRKSPATFVPTLVLLPAVVISDHDVGERSSCH
jgi:hypothetical protein